MSPARAERTRTLDTQPCHVDRVARVVELVAADHTRLAVALPGAQLGNHNPHQHRVGNEGGPVLSQDGYLTMRCSLVR